MALRRSGGKGGQQATQTIQKGICDYIRVKGGWARVVTIVGIPDHQNSGRFRKNSMSGIPDVIGCINGRMVAVEVKRGKDRIRKSQAETIPEMKQAGAAVVVVGDIGQAIDFIDSLA